MASSAAEEKSEAPAPAASGGGGGASKLVPILTIVNLVATVAMIAILFVSFQREKHHTSVEDIAAHPAENEKAAEGEGESKAAGGKETAQKKPADFGKMVTLEQFTVNLSTPGSVAPKFVRVNISLEVPTEDAEAELTSKMPQVRNAIIDLFNSKRPADLATPEGRDYLKEEIKNALNSFLVTGKVKGVFFTNFAVSS